jgi:pilus assembly protein CpaB
MGGGKGGITLREAAMKSKTVILMVVAVACGLAASYMTSKIIAERGNQTEVEKVSVLVARKNLSLGMLIYEPEKLFEEKQFIAGTEPKKAIRIVAELKDRRLNKPLSAEQFVTADDLWDKDKDGLSGQMKLGMRAVGLNVNAQSMVGGFVLPHAHVDVLSVITNAKGETVSKTILQNILVLAVDQSASRPEDGKQAVVASTVTVQVTPEQAERLALAQRMGTISLSLRSFVDNEMVSTTGVTPNGILQGGENNPPEPEEHTSGIRGTGVPVHVLVEPPVQSPPRPSKVHAITIYNGEHGARHCFPLDADGNPAVPTCEPPVTPKL